MKNPNVYCDDARHLGSVFKSCTEIGYCLKEYLRTLEKKQPPGAVQEIVK